MSDSYTASLTELVTKKDLAKKLSVTTRTIDNLTNRGIISRIKVGANSRYDWNEVVQALKSQPTK